MAQVITFIALFAPALATGGFLVNWIGLSRAMLRIEQPAAYIAFHQATNDTFDPSMPVVVVASIVFSALAAIRSAYPAVWALAAACYAGVLMLSLLTNVRINKEVAGWSPTAPPGHWASRRAAWVRFHVLRTLVSLPGLGLCIFAAIGPGKSPITLCA